MRLHAAFLCLVLCGLSIKAAADPPRVELRLEPDRDRCQEPSLDRVLREQGLPRLARFIAPRVCYAAAVELAVRALELAAGRETPARVAKARGPDCDVRCWFDRPTAIIADATLDPDAWPDPPRVPDGRWWLFFLASPDLGDHWYWVAVKERIEGDRARVLLWSER